MTTTSRAVRRAAALALLLPLAAACGARPGDTEPAGAPPLPDPDGWGLHVLAAARAPDGATWVGTYGHGIYVLPEDGTAWRHIAASDADSTSISWDFVNAFAFAADGSVWYGTVGNGFGRSADGGTTWRNWTYDDLGPEWQYVAPNGIAARGDTVYVATADGLRLSGDGGASWFCVHGAGAPAGSASGVSDGCTGSVASLPTEYLLALDVGPNGTIWTGSPAGLAWSRDGGRTWRLERDARLAGRRVRGVAATDDAVWVRTESSLLRSPRGSGVWREASDSRAPARALGGRGAMSELTQAGIAVGGRAGESDVPPAAAPAAPLHTWFRRPIADQDANPFIDQTYRYGSTMGGNFQQHQGVEFNNAAGTPVHAVGAGTVVFAGPAEAGANTVAILHDRRLDGQYVFTTYYHNTSLDVTAGQRVERGQVIAHVGNTGRATNDHLHLEVHVAPTADSSKIVDPDVRYPEYTRNPQLWIEPMPGTGVIAGRVVDADGALVPGAHVYGVAVAEPEETPFAFAETYEDKAHPDPAYGENFAVGDVTPGDYLVGVEIDGERVWRRVTVRPGMVTFVELAPAP